jgi:hypothetical protein
MWCYICLNDIGSSLGNAGECVYARPGSVGPSPTVVSVSPLQTQSNFILDKRFLALAGPFWISGRTLRIRLQVRGPDLSEV